MTANNSQMWLNKKVLVSGATGFIGSQVTDSLVQQGALVTALTRTKPANLALNWIEVSGLTPFPTTEVEAERPEVVIHLATRFQAAHNPNDITALIQSNIEFGTQLLESTKNVGAQFINVSSSWQHFEGESYSPVSLYAATKQAFSDIAQYYFETGLDFRDLTIYDTYGPTDQRNKLIRLLLLAASSGDPIDMGEGNQLINLLYISDAVKAILQIAQPPMGSNLGAHNLVARAEQSISIKQLAQIIEQVTGKTINANWGSRPQRAREMLTDWRFGQPLPNWKPEVSLQEGLAQCWRVLESGS